MAAQAPAGSPATQHVAGTTAWSPLRRIAFRFVFSYLVFYNIPQQGSASLLDVVPKIGGRLNDYLARPLQPLAVWLGQHLFHIKGVGAQFHETGSGDTAMNYVLVFLFLCLSLLSTAVWTAVDRRRTQYRTMAAWLRLLVAFVVATALLEYGFAKVFPGQFGPIFITRLNETYGESSPMALLWTFMSGSRWYTMFGGAAEVLPGLLLFFRRTRTLGALLGAAVLTNVFLLNLCYDVPVKLYSFHLLLMCVFLAAPDIPGLFRLFVLRGQAQLRTDHVPAPERRSLRFGGYVGLGVLMICALVNLGLGSYQPYPAPDDTHLPLYGMWSVEHANATTKLMPWRRVYVDRPGSLLVQTIDGRAFRLKARIDTEQHTMAIESQRYGNGVLHIAPDGANPARHMVLSGPFNGGQIAVDLVRRSPNQYPLLTQGFHWVHEDSPNF